MTNPSLEQVVPRPFSSVESLEVGMQFQANTDRGLSLYVVKVDDDDVTVDGNHPLAGKHLNFNVTVQEVRAATEEEIAHGHTQLVVVVAEPVDTATLRKKQKVNARATPGRRRLWLFTRR